MELARLQTDRFSFKYKGWHTRQAMSAHLHGLVIHDQMSTMSAVPLAMSPATVSPTIEATGIMPPTPGGDGVDPPSSSHFVTFELRSWDRASVGFTGVDCDVKMRMQRLELNWNHLTISAISRFVQMSASCSAVLT